MKSPICSSGFDEREFGAIALVVAFLAMIGFTFFALIFFAFALFDFG